MYFPEIQTKIPISIHSESYLTEKKGDFKYNIYSHEEDSVSLLQQRKLSGSRLIDNKTNQYPEQRATSLDLWDLINQVSPAIEVFRINVALSIESEIVFEIKTETGFKILSIDPFGDVFLGITYGPGNYKSFHFESEIVNIEKQQIVNLFLHND